MGKRRKIIILMILIAVVLFAILKNKGVENTKMIYYNHAFVYVTAIYIDTSGILDIEKQEDLDILKDAVMHSEKEMNLLETNFATAEGEKIVNRYLGYIHQAIDLKQKKFEENEMWRNDGIYEVVDQFTSQYREFTKYMDEIGVEIDAILLEELSQSP